MISIESLLDIANVDAVDKHSNDEPIRTNKMSDSEQMRIEFEVGFRLRHPDEGLANELLKRDGDLYALGYTNESYNSYQAAAASKQAEIDQLNNAISDHVTVRGEYKQRIDQLESAIREYLAKIDKPYRVCHDEKLPLETLRNLVSESKLKRI